MSAFRLHILHSEGHHHHRANRSTKCLYSETLHKFTRTDTEKRDTFRNHRGRAHRLDRFHVLGKHDLKFSQNFLQRSNDKIGSYTFYCKGYKREHEFQREFFCAYSLSYRSRERVMFARLHNYIEINYRFFSSPLLDDDDDFEPRLTILRAQTKDVSQRLKMENLLLLRGDRCPCADSSVTTVGMAVNLLRLAVARRLAPSQYSCCRSSVLLDAYYNKSWEKVTGDEEMPLISLIGS